MDTPAANTARGSHACPAAPAPAWWPGTSTGRPEGDHKLTVALIVSHREDRMISQLACGIGAHRIRRAPARRALRADWRGSVNLILTC